MFGDKETIARCRYSEFVQKGVGQGNRPELTGGGLLRSQGGWAAVKELRRSGAYQKGDERILGDGDFVEGVLSQAEEQFQQKYRMKAKGYDLEKAIQRVAEIMGMSCEEIMESGKDRKRTRARSLLRYWATDQLGISQTRLSRILNLTQPAISQAVSRGREIAKSQSYAFLDD